MSPAIPDAVREAYDPDIRAMTAVLLGASFVLFLLLVNPEFTNPYYVAGLVVTALAVVSAAAVLAVERGR